MQADKIPNEIYIPDSIFNQPEFDWTFYLYNSFNEGCKVQKYIRSDLVKESAWEMFQRLSGEYGYKFHVLLMKEQGVEEIPIAKDHKYWADRFYISACWAFYFSDNESEIREILTKIEKELKNA